LNLRPSGYEPDELPGRPPRDTSWTYHEIRGSEIQKAAAAACVDH
jgi:hypothetical protein